MIAVGFPTRIAEREFVERVRVPKFFIHSTHDEFGPQAEFTEFYASVPEPKELTWVEAADHFFKNSLDEFEAVVVAIGDRR